LKCYKTFKAYLINFLDMNTKVKKIVDKMMEKDLFSQWMGIQRLEEKEGYSQLKMTIRPEMCNGFEIAHGGISFAFADSALAFASNSHGRQAVSIETSISHVKSIRSGDTIIATALEKSLANSIAIYEVTINKENGDLVALFKGTVFRKETLWEV
jgi:acyl-CoA thioesterase